METLAEGLKRACEAVQRLRMGLASLREESGEAQGTLATAHPSSGLGTKKGISCDQIRLI